MKPFLSPKSRAKAGRTLKLAAFLGAATLPSTFLLPGCGGGGSGSGPTTSVQAGGQVNLANGQFANLGFGVLSNDTVYGTLAIVNGPNTVTGTPFPVGTYNVSGNARGKQLTLFGTAPDLGLITINVTLPQNGTAGSFTVKFQNQATTFTGTIVTATPTATATATATPTTTPTIVATAIP